MINEDKKNPSQQDQLNVKSTQYENIPQNVIYSAQPGLTKNFSIRR